MKVRGSTPSVSIIAAVLLAAALAPPAPADPGGPAAEAGRTTGLRSTFDTGVQGYATANGGATSVSWSSTGGRPDGHLVAQASATTYPYVRSGSAMAGDRRSAYGGTLSLDTRSSSGTGVRYYVFLLNSDGIVLYVRFEPDSPSEWQRSSIRLAEGAGWFAGGEAASRADFDTVLGDLDRLEVYALTPSAGTTMRLDNVRLASRVRRTVTLRYVQRRFVGRVTGACTVGQSVTVFRVRPGPDQVVGRATTDRNSEYEVARRATGARYYARIGQRYRDGQGDCLGDASPATRFG